MEITIDYWNELGKQTLLIGSLLSGFSITVVANLLVADKNDRFTNLILKFATLSSGCFLITVFSMVQIVMVTTPGGPGDNISLADFHMARTMGVLALMLGLISLCTIIALSGWTKSKQMGRYTTVIAVMTLLFILSTMINFSA